MPNCSFRFTAGFTEGFDTLDLQEAKALPDELAVLKYRECGTRALATTDKKLKI
jgi:hypothetical protein